MIHPHVQLLKKSQRRIYPFCVFKNYFGIMKNAFACFKPEKVHCERVNHLAAEVLIRIKNCSLTFLYRIFRIVYFKVKAPRFHQSEHKPLFAALFNLKFFPIYLCPYYKLHGCTPMIKYYISYHIIFYLLCQ